MRMQNETNTQNEATIEAPLKMLDKCNNRPAKTNDALKIYSLIRIDFR